MVWVFLIWSENFSNPKTVVTTDAGMELWTKWPVRGKALLGLHEMEPLLKQSNNHESFPLIDEGVRWIRNDLALPTVDFPIGSED